MSSDNNDKTIGGKPALGLGAQPPGPRKVIVLSGQVGGELKTWRLDKERIVIGSVISADVRLTGDGVAPIHAVLEGAPEAMVYDLASDTGVFVNGSKVITQALSNADEVTIGRHKLSFSLEDRSELAAKMIAKFGKDSVWDSEGRKLFFNPNEDFKPLLLEDEREVDEIFDYRPASRTALEVIMSWQGTVLAVEHFVSEKMVTVGSEIQNDFGIPPILSSGKYAIVTRSGGDFVLNFDPQMKGVMQRKGELLPIGGRQPAVIPIFKDDFAKVSIGNVDFYLSFTQAPPRLKRGRLFDKDPFFLKLFLSSLALTLLTIFSLLNMKVVQTLEAEQLPDRIATILYQPEKYAYKPPSQEKDTSTREEVTQTTPVAKETPKPRPTTHVDIQPNPANLKKPVPKEMDTGSNRGKIATQSKKQPAPSKGQRGAKEGEGARAKGVEGTRGKKNAAADKTPQNKAAIPDPRGGKGLGSSNSQTPDIGNVDFLKGATGKIENILAGAGAQLGKGGDSLKGLGGFDTRGNGGLAISGGGKGGGGTSDLAQGVGNKGRGFGRVGTGLGAAGNGSGIIGGQARVAIKSGGPEEAIVMGSIDTDAVEAALLAHKDEFRFCYEKEINAEHPNLSGRIGTSFVIGPSGKVTQAGIESSTMKNANVEGCVVRVIKRIDFPIPRGGGTVHVKYPFKYSSVR